MKVRNPSALAPLPPLDPDDLLMLFRVTVPVGGDQEGARRGPAQRARPGGGAWPGPLRIVWRRAQIEPRSDAGCGSGVVLTLSRFCAQYGGAGLSVMSSSLVSEELAYGCTGIQTGACLVSSARCPSSALTGTNSRNLSDRGQRPRVGARHHRRQRRAEAQVPRPPDGGAAHVRVRCALSLSLPLRNARQVLIKVS